MLGLLCHLHAMKVAKAIRDKLTGQHENGYVLLGRQVLKHLCDDDWQYFLLGSPLLIPS
jgi:hypothetical protein